MVCFYIYRIYHSFDFMWGWCIIELTTWVFAHFRRTQHLVCHYLSYINYQHGNFMPFWCIHFEPTAVRKTHQICSSRPKKILSGSDQEILEPLEIWKCLGESLTLELQNLGQRWWRWVEKPCGGFFDVFWRATFLALFLNGHRLSMHPKLPGWNFERIIENHPKIKQKCQRGN